MLLCDSRVEGGVVPIYNNMLHDEEHFFIHTTRGGGSGQVLVLARPLDR